MLAAVDISVLLFISNTDWGNERYTLMQRHMTPSYFTVLYRDKRRGGVLVRQVSPVPECNEAIETTMYQAL